MTEEELMHLPEYLAVLASPVPDQPRLAVAHAIAAVWPERADSIELGVAKRIEERKGEGRTPARLESSRRESALVKQLRLYETADAVCARYGARVFGVRRGFADMIEVDVTNFLEHGPTLVRTFPVLSLTLEGSSREIARLVDCRALRQLTSLGLRCPDLGDEGIRQLVASPHLSNLRHLWTSHAGLRRRGYEHVIEATQTTLANLEMFSSNGNAIDSPQERQPSYDSISGFPVYETVGILPEEGAALEAKYGYQKVLHWCSRFGPELEKWPYE
jgi:hypothetical protein